MRLLPAALLLLTASCASLDFELEETRVLTEPLDGSGPVSLQVATDNGSIGVHEDPSVTGLEVRALVHVQAATEELARARLERVGVSIDQGAEGVAVEADWPGARRGNERVSLLVLVPALDGVRLRAGNGSLEVRGAAGPVVGETGNGRVLLEGCAGGARLATGNGSIELVRTSGEVVGATFNGPVQVVDHAGALDLESSNGSHEVSLASGAAGALQLRTGNGSIELSVAADWSGVVEASTGVGRVRFRGREGTREKGEAAILAVGAGGERSVLRTGNGSIEVVVREKQP